MRALMLELLAWIAARPRTYDETMRAWRTSCPRMPIWEDATTDGLVEVCSVEHGTMSNAIVRVTAAGRAFLAAAHTAATPK